MHARKSARDAGLAAHADDRFFAPRGDVLLGDGTTARVFAERLRDLKVPAAELAAMALLHEIFHAVLQTWRRRAPESYGRLLATLDEKLGGTKREALHSFLRLFPNNAIYRGVRTPDEVLREPGAENEYTDEVLLLWLTNQNPAYDAVRPV